MNTLRKNTPRKVPRKKHFQLMLSDIVEIQLELARNNRYEVFKNIYLEKILCRMLWRGENLSFERLDSQMNLDADFLEIVMNKQKVITVSVRFPGNNGSGTARNAFYCRIF